MKFENDHHTGTNHETGTRHVAEGDGSPSSYWSVVVNTEIYDLVFYTYSFPLFPTKNK